MNLTEVIAMKTKTNGKEIIHKMDHHLYIWFLALIFVRKIIALKFTFDTFFMIVCVVLTRVSLCDFLVAVYYHSYYYLFLKKTIFTEKLKQYRWNQFELVQQQQSIKNRRIHRK